MTTEELLAEERERSAALEELLMAVQAELALQYEQKREDTLAFRSFVEVYDELKALVPKDKALQQTLHGAILLRNTIMQGHSEAEREAFTLVGAAQAVLSVELASAESKTSSAKV